MDLRIKLIIEAVEILLSYPEIYKVILLHEAFLLENNLDNLSDVILFTST
jgi:hypothetical protein